LATKTDALLADDTAITEIDELRPLIAEGQLMGFALTEVKVGVNAKKVRAYVEPDPQGDGFRVIDQLSGGFQYAILRWRLDPQAQWSMESDGCRSDCMELTFTADRPVLAKIVEGWESSYYWEMHPIPVLELRVPEGCREITTDIRLIATMPTVRHDESMCDISTIRAS
jgi:hypothetical protein